jgi:signal transduction histidine kinase
LGSLPENDAGRAAQTLYFRYRTVDGDLPGWRVLIQVLGNAIKFTEDGSVNRNLQCDRTRRITVIEVER